MLRWPFGANCPRAVPAERTAPDTRQTPAGSEACKKTPVAASLARINLRPDSQPRLVPRHERTAGRGALASRLVLHAGLEPGVDAAQQGRRVAVSRGRRRQAAPAGAHPPRAGDRGGAGAGERRQGLPQLLVAAVVAQGPQK